MTAASGRASVRRSAAAPLPRNARVDEHRYAHMSSAELHQAALERVAHYSRVPPYADMIGTYALLRSAWQWVADRNRAAEGEQP